MYIGRLDEIKGINFLIEAWKDIDENIELYVIGTGPEKEKIKKFIEKNNIKNVKMLGFMQRNKIFDIIQKSRAVVVPSNWNEPFGMVIIEAFSKGVPIIASKIGSIPYIVDHNVNGILVDPGDKLKLKESINNIFYDNKLNKALGKNAYNKFNEYYTDIVNYNRLIEIYEELVGDKFDKKS